MSARQLAQWADGYPLVLLGFFVALPLAAWACGRWHGRAAGGTVPWKFFYSILVYLACVPGIFAGVLTAYTFFFTRENLVDANLLVYLAPIASMVVTLILIRKNVEFDQVPGFDRLSGLMVMIAGSFVLALVLQKMRVFIFFGGSIGKFFLLAAGIFALLRWGAHTLFRRSDEPKQEWPKMPGS